LNLYGASVNVFEPSHARGIAALLASCIAELLPRTVPTARSLQSHDGRRVAAARPAALIHRAEAAVSVSEHLSTQAAFSRLAQRSRDQNRSIFDVAHDAVGGPDRARSAGLAAP
jgi:Zn-finger protein